MGLAPPVPVVASPPPVAPSPALLPSPPPPVPCEAPAPPAGSSGTVAWINVGGPALRGFSADLGTAAGAV
jgi:hypothetical protein